MFFKIVSTNFSFHPGDWRSKSKLENMLGNPSAATCQC